MSREDRDPGRLEEAGWLRRSVACGHRLEEAVQTYRSLGFEVLLVPALGERAAGDETGPCTACLEADEDPDRHQIIYTRPGRAGGDGGADPFG